MKAVDILRCSLQLFTFLCFCNCWWNIDRTLLHNIGIKWVKPWQNVASIIMPFLEINATKISVGELDTTDYFSSYQGARFSKVPVTFRARRYILKSKSIVRWHSF